ncbi:major facilitator superfamily domain-containing protein [Thelonectria olida]|uniref:Major facilitator superfamily domain-containing protein n=1 Tax=Thelonectria olida TaxID=1576542 RepID=A0A9P8VNR1_9HYPO|nr:major facilitator superfamily domain-containing protein [Thelonectria olida]
MATVHGQVEREEIQNELHIEVLPGTEIMTDVGSHHFIKSEDSSCVLIPQPSQDPHDPLNWKRSWKLSAITTVSTMTFTQGFAPLALAPMAPISSSFGRCPVYFVSQLVCIASHIIRARAMSYRAFMGSCILNGIGAGPAETLQPAVIADIFFLHDRGTWNALYWVIYTGSLMLAPIISGPMADRVGWQNFWWLNIAMTGVSFVLGIFGFPETKWYPSLGKGTPSKQQWSLFQRNASPLRTIWFDLWTPWKLLIFPIVLFASFIVSWSCSNFLILNLTQSQVFSAPPYNMSAQSIGLLNFAILAGALIGLVTAGPFSDWVSARATTRIGGIREPEMRLPAMIPYVIIMIFGNVITTVGYERKWPWPVIVVLGYTSSGIQVAALPTIASTYAVDSYRPVSGPLFVAITVNKNLWGYGMGKFITPWITEAGYLPPFMTNMALTAFFCAIGTVFYFYGKTFRRWIKDSSVHSK